MVDVWDRFIPLRGIAPPALLLGLRFANLPGRTGLEWPELWFPPLLPVELRLLERMPNTAFRAV